jgi:mitochondrial fission protein ELM1
VDTRPLRALLLTDDKPGHYLRSEGILAAIDRKRPVETLRMPIQRRRLAPAAILQSLANLGAPPGLILRLGYGIEAAGLPKADLVVSAGGNTLAANAAAAAQLGVPNIFYGRLRQLAPAKVRVVIVPYESFAQFPNHLIALPPSAIEPAVRRDGQVAFSRTSPPKLVGVLVGGDSGTLRFTSAEWHALIAFLESAHDVHGISWLVTTSRRSGDAITIGLSELAASQAGGIDRYVAFGRGSSSTVGEILSASDAILVTDDSTSMIAEAVSAQLPTVGLVPSDSRHEQGEAEFRGFVQSKGWYRPLAISHLSPDAFIHALAEVSPRKLSALDELAEALVKRLPDLFAR